MHGESNSDLAFRAVAELRSQVENEPISIMALSDEELAILDDAEDIGREKLSAPLPWYFEHNESDRRLLRDAALRSLTVRGLGFARNEPSKGELNLDLDRNLHALLTMRQAMSSMTIVNRASARGMRCRVLFGQAPDLVLEEDVTEQGFHSFTLGRSKSIAQRLAEFVDPEPAADKWTNPTQQWNLQENQITPENFEPVERALFVTAMRRDDLVGGQILTRRWAIYTLEDQVIMGSPTKKGNEAVLHLRNVTSTELQQELTAIVT
ncbi:MAG: hypothetical protein HOQ05_01195 [Corynebacteriales bacterium]|nr:hypothetical protein [Mycobacteriales bacterium]